MTTLRRPKRYRDVLAMLKTLARDPRVPLDGLRALLSGVTGESYTQADIDSLHSLAVANGWELMLDPVDHNDATITFDSPEAYQAELRRLHGELRQANGRIAQMQREHGLGMERSRAKNQQRQDQLKAAGVTSIDEAFALLAETREVLHQTTKGLEMAVRSNVSRDLYDTAEEYDAAIGSHVLIANARRVLLKTPAVPS